MILIIVALIVLGLIGAGFLLFRNILSATTPCTNCHKKRVRIWMRDAASGYVYLYCKACGCRFRMFPHQPFQPTDDPQFDRFYTQQARDHWIDSQ